jgi:hypothetical protein
MNEYFPNIEKILLKEKNLQTPLLFNITILTSLCRMEKQ